MLLVEISEVRRGPRKELRKLPIPGPCDRHGTQEGPSVLPWLHVKGHGWG